MDIPFYGREHHNLQTPNVDWIEQQRIHLFIIRQTSEPNFILSFSNILTISNTLLNMLPNQPRARVRFKMLNLAEATQGEM